MSISFYIIQILVSIFGVLFAIKISSFKKDAWYFYFLGTFVGFISFYNFAEFSILGFIKGLIPFSHDLGLSLLAIIILKKHSFKPQTLTKKNILPAAVIIIFTILFMIIFNHLTLPMSPFYSVSMFISDLFGIIVFVGSALLIFGYIAGLLINSIYCVQMIVMSIYYQIIYPQSITMFLINSLFNILNLLIFTYAYIKNKKLLKDSK
ncbi:hypothetical protein [Francisella sp. 19X1-34]|uniref:hypothetical protein n=1 Tax=Francisella sp. 19X1-34 TaxID=3087177 RepID=UPI002E300FBD|nr:hypothetical protein [Francisella sp. 19X1-34]MED7789527.1 hypothetical protein [Francisella sp. 19X1-34]